MSDLTLAAGLFGAAGVASACVWGLLRNRRAMLFGQVAQVISFGAHFALIGAYTASAMCALSFLQLASALAPRSRFSVLSFWATAPAIGLLAGLTWHGPASAAAALGLALLTLARWQKSELGLRYFALGATMAFGVHNWIVGSPFGLATDALALVTNGWRILVLTSPVRGAWVLARRAAPDKGAQLGVMLRAFAPHIDG
jgi:hypothetical protein